MPCHSSRIQSRCGVVERSFITFYLLTSLGRFLAETNLVEIYETSCVVVDTASHLRADAHISFGDGRPELNGASWWRPGHLIRSQPFRANRREEWLDEARDTNHPSWTYTPEDGGPGLMCEGCMHLKTWPPLRFYACLSLRGPARLLSWRRESGFGIALAARDQCRISCTIRWDTESQS
jgi:hypothetical protein